MPWIRALGLPAAAFLLAGLAALFAAPAAAQDGDRPATRPDLARLIELLDSADFATRERATRELVEAREAAREPLIAARMEGSLERRMRIDRILENLGVHAASRPARHAHLPVTVDIENKRLSEVVGMLSAASGRTIRAPEHDPLVTLRVRDVSFLEALDRLCDQAECAAAYDPKTAAFVLERSGAGSPPRRYAGAFRVSLVLVAVNRQSRFVGAATGGGNVQVRIEAEHAGAAIGVMTPVSVNEIVDERGRSLKPPAAVSHAYPMRFDDKCQVHVWVPIGLPERDAQTIARMRFTLAVVVASEVYEAELPASPGETVAEGEFRATIEEWKDSPGGPEVRIAIERPALTSGGRAPMPLSDDVVTFHAADGTPIAHRPTMKPSAGDGPGYYGAILPAEPPVATVRVSSLKAFEVIELPVSFEDVPLP